MKRAAINSATGLQGTCEFGRSYELGGGHNAIGHEWIKAIHPGFVFAGYPEHYFAEFDLDRLDPAAVFVPLADRLDRDGGHADLRGLRRELSAIISNCAGGTVGDCRILEAFGDDAKGGDTK